MLKKIGIPVVALLAMLAFMAPAPASAAVRFGVGVYAAPSVPYYAAPAPVYPDPYVAPVYPYAYAPGYVYPSVGLGFGYGGGFGYSRGYYGGHYDNRRYEGGRGYYGGGHGFAAGGHRR